jgi:enterochelin esterase-like enzyme
MIETEKAQGITVETIHIESEALNRTVQLDCYLPVFVEDPSSISLLLINDGQDLAVGGFSHMLTDLLVNNMIRPVVCVGIHCGEDRKNEYGVAFSPDYKGRGAKAAAYQEFVLSQLLPQVLDQYKLYPFIEKAFAGFSLGALSAIDIGWNHPQIFSRIGVFSGSLWWRSKDKNDKDYNQTTDRLMHLQVRKGEKHPGQKFFFQCGELDESEDRNHNGVIDSIDDTLDLIRELVRKGYREGKDIAYMQMPEGKHDVPTWMKAFPAFLRWGWAKQK